MVMITDTTLAFMNVELSEKDINQYYIHASLLGALRNDKLVDAVLNEDHDRIISLCDTEPLPDFEAYATNGECVVITDDALFLSDYTDRFKRILKWSSQKNITVHFFVKNNLGHATALIVEWVSMGGTHIMTSFLGIGNTASTEQVLLALASNGFELNRCDLSCIAKVKDFLRESCEIVIDPHQPIFGAQIFCVESGTHVNGVLKDPSNYEPFPPETIGVKRSIVVGSQSGKSAIQMKLKEMQQYLDDEHVLLLLHEVKTYALHVSRVLTDEEFRALIRIVDKGCCA